MSNPLPKPVRLEAPDASYHLTPAERANIRPGMNPEAVERLLRWLPPEERASMLVNFSDPRSEYVPGQPTRLSVPNILAFNDPTLDAALEAIWAPVWAKASDEDLVRHSDVAWPGLEAERDRRNGSR